MAPDRTYALIMAGGRGTRLWPHSRQRIPKQFLRLLGSRSMLQETVDRILPLVPVERVYVVTSRPYALLVAEQLPDLPWRNILVEPEGKGTAAAIGLGALYIRRQDPQATMIVLSADHYIGRPDRFLKALEAAVGAAQDGSLVTLGIAPTRPDTGYGYIELGEVLEEFDGHAVHRVVRFTEKPDAATALRYLEEGRHVWNAGIFIWTLDAILAAFREHMPFLAERLARLEAALATDEERRVLREVWSPLPEIAVDVGVMEKARNAKVIPVDIAWSDVGDWSALQELLPADGEGNVVRGRHLGVETRSCLIFNGSGRLVTTVGVRDLIVVDTDDALLICHRSQAQKVKELVARLRQGGYEHLL